MRDFNRFSKILWRFWPCFFCLPSFRHFREGFYWETAKKIFREGEPDRTEGEGESRTETEWEGKRRNAPGKNTYGGTAPVLSERSFWPMRRRRVEPAGPKKNFGEGASIKIFRSPAGQGGAEAFQISEKIPAAGGGGGRRGPPENPRAEGAKSARSGGKRGGKPAPRKGPPAPGAARKF